jgi:hypothetical protein
MADSFGSGAHSFSIEFVTIGDPGNLPDTTGIPNPAGSVPYVYRIGKYEISEQMIDKANALGGLGITKDARGPDKPATRVSWFEAARFVNWLNISTGSAPAYKFDASGEFQLWAPSDPGYNPANLFRNSQARYFLPSADEWYKAAFYDPTAGVYFDFPHGSNTAPVPIASGTAPGTAVYDQPFAQGPADVMFAGGPSPWGTVGQAGNVWEWEETAVGLVNNDPQEYRGFRGAAWLGGGSGNPTSLSSSFRHSIQLPDRSVGDIGFRIAAAVPEPEPIHILTLGLLLAHLLRGYVDYGIRTDPIKTCRPVLLLRGRAFILALLAFLVTRSGTATAAVLYETGALGPTGITWDQMTSDPSLGVNVSRAVFGGVRFRLTTPVALSHVGGHFVARAGADRSFFGAIVRLEGETDYPDSIDLSTPDVRGATLLTFPSASAEAFGQLDLTLEPGLYALVFGSGLFGATGAGASLRNNTEGGMPDYIGFQSGFGWGERASQGGKRFVIEGHFIPEPSAIVIAMIGLVVARRACSTYGLRLTECGINNVRNHL